MQNILNLKENLDKHKYLVLSFLIIVFFLLVTVVFKSDQNIIKKSEIEDSMLAPDLETFKKFLLGKIKSPFTNLNYKIKKGDTIQKILKRLKVQNNEIQLIINQYKKYSNPNQLLIGNSIQIILEKQIS